MLKSALVFRKVFKNFNTKFPPYTRELRRQVGDAPTDEDWEKISSFIPFLQIFYEATLKLSGSRYVTGNTFVEEIYDVGFAISKYLNDSNEGLKHMALQMKLKYDTYWSNVHNLNILMFIALVLDPRNKLAYTEYIVRNSYKTSDSSTLCKLIKHALRALYDVYANQMGSSSTSNIHGERVEGVEGVKDVNLSRLRDSFVKQGGNKDTSSGKTELEKYLGDEIEPQVANFDILAWWAAQGKTYPILKTMARDILAIPVSSVASESAFSTGGRVLDSFRTSLSTKMVEALVCGQDWMRQANVAISVEENLVELEKMEEGMNDLAKEQPTIIIDETLEVSDLTFEESGPHLYATSSMY